MNPSSQNNPDVIRSDIDDTRRRMDDTMNALGDRLHPQHLLDEVLGFFRREGSNNDARIAQVREKITQSADHAMHAVVDTVKSNPIPAVLIGAGLAWMVYESRRDKSGYSYSNERSYSGTSRSMRDPDLYSDEPLDYPAPSSVDDESDSEAGSKLGQIKDTIAEKAGSVANRVKEQVSNAGKVVQDKVGSLRERAGQMNTTVQDGTRRLYDRTREQASSTVEHHPLEVGLAALAAGLVAGLALPTPAAVNRTVGPMADKLRDRAEEAGAEMLEKGKRVAEAATSAVKGEAESQGLTAESLRQKAGAVMDKVKEATKDSAEREGLTPGSANPPPSGTGQP